MLDEFGLIICGWPGQYDTALKAATERCPNRRYPTYWLAHDTLSDIAERLITLRAGVKITIRGPTAGVRENLKCLRRLIEDPEPAHGLTVLIDLSSDVPIGNRP